NKLQAFQSGKKSILNIKLKCTGSAAVNNLHIAVGIDDEKGNRITHLNSEATNESLSIHKEMNSVDIVMDKLALRQGNYAFTLFATVNNEIADWVQESGSFDVEIGDFYNTGKLPPDNQGSFYMDHKFIVK
nr:Wzt carbohydrate-binding domain-containing protein [Bacteroidota bacterium]